MGGGDCVVMVLGLEMMVEQSVAQMHAFKFLFLRFWFCLFVFLPFCLLFMGSFYWCLALNGEMLKYTKIADIRITSKNEEGKR